MAYKMNRTWKDWVEGPAHQSLTRRDLLKRGLATGALAVALPKAFGMELIKTAYADTMSGLPAVKNPGAIAQFYSNGGPTMGARFFSEAQAAAMNSTMASNYGITGTNLMKLGPNLVIDSTSVFGFTLLQGPPGFAGGPAAWKTQVLSKLSGGGHLGPFNADDGAGSESGLLGSVSLDKAALIGKDIFFNGGTRAAWTKGTPSVPASYSTYMNLVNAFSMTPSATGNTNVAEMTNAADGAIAISNAMSGVLGTTGRKGASAMMNSVGCALYGNAAVTDPTFGANLFTPGSISQLSNALDTTMLSLSEQAMLTAYYQSAVGVVGGVTIELGGRDYHATDPQTVIAPADQEDARSFVMFLAACYAAQQPGVMIYIANGQAIARGVQSVTSTINGSAVTMNCPIAAGDAGGHYNGGLMMFYHPAGHVPNAKYSGTMMSASGDVIMDPNVGSFQNAVGGLFMTAHDFISGSVPNTLVKRMQALGQAAVPSNLVLI